jgi:adenosylcobinamide-GDP ribazoletransferase
MWGALSFLTVIGGGRRPGARDGAWFPAVGLALGALLGLSWWAARRAWPPGLAAAVVVAADLGLTGLLHFDGLVDAADGLLPPVDRERRLAIMSTPEVGAFGVGVGAVVLLLRWAAVASLRPAGLGPSVALFAGLWGLSRAGAAGVLGRRPYARGQAAGGPDGTGGGGGLAQAFAGPAPLWPLLAGAAISLSLAGLWRPGPGLAGAAAVVVAAGAVQVLAERRVGGYTGDTLGAGILAGETAGLVLAAARW